MLSLQPFFNKNKQKMILEIILIVVGLGVVLWGADRFTDGACALARRLKVSELVIGLTVVSLGTSLPEFIVSLMSLLQGSSDMSVGNVMGSNIFNIAFVIGLCGSVVPMAVTQITPLDWGMLVGSCILVWLTGWTSRKFGRWEGILLTACYVSYIVWLIVGR